MRHADQIDDSGDPLRGVKIVILTLLIGAAVIGGIVTAPNMAAWVGAWMLGGFYAEV